MAIRLIYAWRISWGREARLALALKIHSSIWIWKCPLSLFLSAGSSFAYLCYYEPFTFGKRQMVGDRATTVLDIVFCRLERVSFDLQGTILGDRSSSRSTPDAQSSPSLNRRLLYALHSTFRQISKKIVQKTCRSVDPNERAVVQISAMTNWRSGQKL